ncbi:hypothetical protein [uncultured Paracoccus sp.]|uniref:hypothetical protein n=1 Tax=uncultured Paracoccus sp. TaxID=189685 RepID=UPI00262E2E97|nr:hypothetical protein [uncultured Paracoccus sp.]
MVVLNFALLGLGIALIYLWILRRRPGGSSGESTGPVGDTADGAENRLFIWGADMSNGDSSTESGGSSSGDSSGGGDGGGGGGGSD